VEGSERPFPAIHLTVPPLQRGPSFRTFAAGAKSKRQRTGSVRDKAALCKCGYCWRSIILQMRPVFRCVATGIARLVIQRCYIHRATDPTFA